MDANWISAAAGAIATLLSAVAVIVAIWVARQTNKQTAALADEQALREHRAYFAERKAEFREQCRAVLRAANAIETMLNPRVSALISAPAGEVDTASTRSYLARLSSDVNLLTTFAGSTSGIPAGVMPTVSELLEEAAWIYSDSLHLAILVTQSDGADGVYLGVSQDVVDALLNGSAVNLEPRLMPGYDTEAPNGEGADSHGAWRAAYRRRQALLLDSGIVTAQPLPSSLAEVAARALGWVSIRRFADLANDVLSSWGEGDLVEFRSGLLSGGKK